jgi:hypothetical protein
MSRSFVVISGTGVKDFREWVPSAAEALHVARVHMKLRRPAVRIEDERRNPVSLFELREMAGFQRRKPRRPERSE